MAGISLSISLRKDGVCEVYADIFSETDGEPCLSAEPAKFTEREMFEQDNGRCLLKVPYETL